MLKWISMGLGVLLAACPVLAASSGTVLSATGAVQTEGGRALAAGDALAAGEVVSTGAGAGAALAVGDLWLEIGPDTLLALEADGSASVRRGIVRVVDLSEGGTAVTLLTPHARIAAGASDTEVVVEPERDEVCERRGEIRVAPIGDPEAWTTTSSGQCAVVAGGAITSQPAAAARLALRGAQIDVAVASHFSPTDVAAPAAGLDLFPLDPDKRTYLSCDDAASCGGRANVQVLPRTSPTPTPTPTPSLGFGTGPANPPGGFGTGPANPPPVP